MLLYFSRHIFWNCFWHYNEHHNTNDHPKFACSFKSNKIGVSKILGTLFHYCNYCGNIIIITMPANKKFLTTSPLQRFAKFTAGFIGGYIVTITFHLAISQWIDRADILITMAFSGFIMWASLMIVAFIAKNGWKIWGIYILISMLFSTITYLNK